MEDKYYLKYLKYKQKYIELKNLHGGLDSNTISLLANLRDASMFIRRYNQQILDNQIKLASGIKETIEDLDKLIKQTEDSKFILNKESTINTLKEKRKLVYYKDISIKRQNELADISENNIYVKGIKEHLSNIKKTINLYKGNNQDITNINIQLSTYIQTELLKDIKSIIDGREALKINLDQITDTLLNMQ